MARILIDCRFAQKKVGLGRYTRGLVPELLQESSDEFFLLLHKDDDGSWLPDTSNFTVIITKIAHYSLLEQLYIPILLLRYSIQEYVVLHFNASIFSTIRPIIVIHDLILHWYPNTESFLKKTAYKFLLYINTIKAKKIIAVSNSTYNDIGKVYGRRIAKKTIHITEGIEQSFALLPKNVATTLVESLGITTPYILYVGNAKEHKNVPTLIEGFVLAHLPNTQLVLVCNDPLLVNLYKKTPAVQFVSSVTDKELTALYTNARAFITASKYEGFCLPVIEARVCGLPLLLANSPAINELADTDHDTILFEPTTQGVTNAIEQLATFTNTKSTVGVTDWNTVAKHVLLTCL